MAGVDLWVRSQTNQCLTQPIKGTTMAHQATDSPSERHLTSLWLLKAVWALRLARYHRIPGQTILLRDETKACYADIATPPM